MEALLCKRLGDPTVPISSESSISISTSHPIPSLDSPTAVRVRIRATSLNYANYLQILGKYQEKPPLPFIPGSDYSGVVESVGNGVSRFKVGDRVCSFAALGSFAEMIVAEEKDLYLVPDGCDLVAAGALPVAFGTSHVALVHRAKLGPGQVLLVLGAAGGVGLSAVQIGKVCGSIVIAVARGAEKVRFLESLGVDHVVDLSKGNIIESVKGFLKARKLKGVETPGISSMDSRNTDGVAYEESSTDGVPNNLIGEREKLKETDEFKRALEEELASRQLQLQIQAEEAQRLRKRRKAETMRLLDMERRQRQRLEEVRETQKKDEETINLKEKFRAEIREELENIELRYRDMASLLRALGVPVGGGLSPKPREINAAYKQALLRFHPDRASRSDIRQQVEAEEIFKLISRLKEKLL